MPQEFLYHVFIFFCFTKLFNLFNDPLVIKTLFFNFFVFVVIADFYFYFFVMKRNMFLKCFLSGLRLNFLVNSWFTQENVPCVDEKKVHSEGVG